MYGDVCLEVSTLFSLKANGHFEMDLPCWQEAIMFSQMFLVKPSFKGFGDLMKEGKNKMLLCLFLCDSFCYISASIIEFVLLAWQCHSAATALLTGECTLFILIFILLPPLLSIHQSVLSFPPFLSLPPFLSVPLFSCPLYLFFNASIGDQSGWRRYVFRLSLHSSLSCKCDSS